MGRPKKKKYDDDEMSASNIDFDSSEDNSLEEDDLYEDDIYDELMDEMSDEALENDPERKKNLKKEFYVKRSRFERRITKVPGIKTNRS